MLLLLADLLWTAKETPGLITHLCCYASICFASACPNEAPLEFCDRWDGCWVQLYFQCAKPSYSFRVHKNLYLYNVCSSHVQVLHSAHARTIRDTKCSIASWSQSCICVFYACCKLAIICLLIQLSFCITEEEIKKVNCFLHSKVQYCDDLRHDSERDFYFPNEDSFGSQTVGIGSWCAAMHQRDANLNQFKLL